MPMVGIARVAWLGVALFASLTLAAEPPPPTKAAGLIDGLGSLHHPIAIHAPLGQKLFDQGLTLVYGFNHDEAIRSFRRAAALDSEAVMPLWGIAYALGPNINLDVDPEREKAAYEATQKALRLAKGAPENERAYVEALAKRYSDDPNADLKKLSVDFANAMKELSERYPDDLDAATLYAESLMDLNPWKLWTPEGEPGENTEEILRVLESVLSRDPTHVGANHYYIHAVEASPHPERALASAARLEKLVPNAGHLVHMPSHIYMRTGFYAAAARQNEQAARVDEAYIKATNAQGVYPLMYYSHNLDFLAAAEAMAGRYAAARKAADELESVIKPVVKEMPMAEFALARPILIDLRFRRFDPVLKRPEPAENLVLTRAVWHYARGVALAAKGHVDGALVERVALGIALGAVPEDAMWILNPAHDVLAVAPPALDARIAEAKGDREGAVAAWRKAVEAQDAIPYDEPPDWYYPVRESLGAALFLAGDKRGAEEVFREDLKRNPRNPRSLFGLWETLKAQKKSTDAEWLRRQFQEAWKGADVEIRMEDL
jgi:tetratricopeptide (TPR) repeat protein